MGKLDQGLLGGYSGKLGTTVGATWKGINVVRTYQPNVANPNTVKQQNHRSLFKDWITIATFLLNSHIKPLWDSRAKRMSGYNAFIQANMLHASPDGIVDPELFILSQGRIGPQEGMASNLNTNGDIQFSWDSSDLPLYGSSDDELYAVFLNAEGEVIGSAAEAAIRSENTVSIPKPVSSDTEEVYAAVAWRSPDGKFQSNTQHFYIIK